MTERQRYPGINRAWTAFWESRRGNPHYPADDFKAGYRAGLDAARDECAALQAARARAEVEAVQRFVARVNARAEASMIAGNPLEGSHWRAIAAELALLEDGTDDR